ncbi:Ankyrin repeat domain-containing protein 26 [Tupaia chinensis]|uniref:Ankyrin repeat domain-containing protein 26 n=1 Tax=Tupaia chinensis TaxID=246437 RepID=L9KY48_TUPCH|nr:Ankyrin repeat domain-containing protein 26 [Tupaia chinensis]
MELRIRDLEPEFFKIRTSQEDSKPELEKYKQLYLEESQVRKSLSDKLNKTNEKLAAVNAKLLVEKQNRYLLSSFTTREVLESLHDGNPNNSLVHNRNLISRETSMIPTSTSQPSNKSTENFLFQTHQELKRNESRELREAASEFVCVL